MSYQIADQPTESSLRNYVVRPSVPLLAFMLGGAWLSWPWFAFNAVAMGSPTRKQEIGIVAGAFAATAALAMVLIALVERELIPVEGMPLRLAILAIMTFKLAATYYMQTVQERTFHIYEYYKGPIRPAERGMFVARLLRGVVIGLIDHPLWVIIVASLGASGVGDIVGLSTGLWGGVLGAVLGAGR